MTPDEYGALCARITTAKRLPQAVLDRHKAAYDALCARALEYEFAHKRFPLREIVDDGVRMVVEHLLNSHAAMLRAESAEAYRAQAMRVLAACLALVAEDADRALAAFGYPEEP